MEEEKLTPVEMHMESQNLLFSKQEKEEMQKEAKKDEEQFLQSEKEQNVQDSDACSATFRGIQDLCGNLVKACFCPCFFLGCGPVIRVRQGTVAIVKEFGRYTRTVPPGYYIVNTCTEQYLPVDMRTQVDNIQAQSVLTSDNVSIRIDAVVIYQIKDPFKATFRVDSFKFAIDNLIRGSLKNIVGENKLQELLDDRRLIDMKLAAIVDNKAHVFGIKVFTIETKEIYLPANMQRAMATVAESLKEKEAKIIDAEGQLLASSILKKAADIMTENPASLQLQYFEVLKQISVENNKTIIIPDSLTRVLGALK
jgi:regulator of protease activity HflC (stomatin/prohibitin superfamily)